MCHRQRYDLNINSQSFNFCFPVLKKENMRRNPPVVSDIYLPQYPHERGFGAIRKNKCRILRIFKKKKHRNFSS
jgi:hypothetical protein